MALVEMIRSPIDFTSPGTAHMHEHAFVLSGEIRQSYPGYRDEATPVADTAARLTLARRRGQIETMLVANPRRYFMLPTGRGRRG
jgi:predicted metal-dependent phosphotriesterase family hydrolase